MSYIIDADKLLELVEEGMCHSKLCAKTEPITQNGKYDVVSDMIRRMDLFTYNQLKLIRDYIIENRTWLIGKGDISFIEYSRTDAFIEKAIEYIITHIPDMHTLGIAVKMDECIIEDFRKYMEE